MNVINDLNDHNVINYVKTKTNIAKSMDLGSLFIYC